MTENCEYCDDGNGGSIYPYFGLAPHVHTQPILGTEFTGEVPKNFSPDGNGTGVYTHCLYCEESDLPASVIESLKEVP